LAEEEVQYVGEPICVIAAESLEAMKIARRQIGLTIKPLPAILSISEAVKKESFIGPRRTIETGDLERSLREAPRKLKGRIIIRGQEHFYLESHASIAYPGENGQIEIHSSSQHPTEVQHMVAEALGLKFHEVVCVVKRMGGAFGGKESQAG